VATEGAEGPPNDWLAGPWKELATSHGEVCGIDFDDRTRCSGETELPDGLHGLAMGSESSLGVACALDLQGQAVCSGGSVDDELPNLALSALSVGLGSVCGIADRTGEIMCWDWAMPERR
jgi:hypothetical protein